MFQLKKRILDTLPKTNQLCAATDDTGFTSLQQSVYNVLSSYQVIDSNNTRHVPIFNSDK